MTLDGWREMTKRPGGIAAVARFVLSALLLAVIVLAALPGHAAPAPAENVAAHSVSVPDLAGGDGSDDANLPASAADCILHSDCQAVVPAVAQVRFLPVSTAVFRAGEGVPLPGLNAPPLPHPPNLF